MNSALQTTLETLANSRNEAVLPALVAALDSPDGRIYEGAIKALIARRSKAGHLAVLKRWHLLTPAQREVVQEGRGRMSGALRDAVLADDQQLFQNASELVDQITEYDLVPTLVTLAENQKSEHAQAATDLVLRLVNRLSEMVHSPRDYNDRRDPQAIRRFVLESLERSAERFRRHERTELVEALVILAGPTCDLLGKILDDHHHACYPTVINTLSHSKSAGVLELLISFLQTEKTSLNVLNMISRRTDDDFLNRLFSFTDEETFSKAAKNLCRIRSFAWLKKERSDVDRLAEQDQVRVLRLVSASGMKQDDVLDLLDSVLSRGEPAARLEACEILASIAGDRPSHIVLRTVRDVDPYVQAAATRQLRDRHLPGAMSILLKLVDSPHEVVQDASREALSEFSFENFLSRFDTLHDDARLSTGAVVRKVDRETIPSLLAEMENKSRKKRMRAVEMAEVMQLVPQVSEGLLGLLDDEDHLVRAAAADTLHLCPTPEVQQALQHATADSSPAVQNAAKSSLSVFADIPGLPSVEAANPTEGQL